MTSEMEKCVCQYNFCVGFLPHIFSASDIFCVFLSFFLSLFICPLIEVLVTWFLVWVFRREKTLSRLCFVGGHSFQLFVADFEDFSRCAFSLQGK